MITNNDSEHFFNPSVSKNSFSPPFVSIDETSSSQLIATPRTPLTFLREVFNRVSSLRMRRRQVHADLQLDSSALRQTTEKIKEKAQTCQPFHSVDLFTAVQDNEQPHILSKTILPIHHKQLIISSLKKLKGKQVDIERILDILDNLNIPLNSEVDDQHIFLLINAEMKSLNKIIIFQNFDVSHLVRRHIDIQSQEGQLILIQLAKTALLYQKIDISKNIHKFQINPHSSIGREALLDMMRQLIEKWGYLAENIENFGFDNTLSQDKKTLIEIAKLLATHKGKITKYLHKFGLNKNNPEDGLILKELAQLSAPRGDEDLLQNLDVFGFDNTNEEDRQILIKIFKTFAKENAFAATLHIQKIGLNSLVLKDRQILMELAKIAITCHAENTIQHIKNFGFDTTIIENKQALVELAFLVADQGEDCLLKHLDDFGFDPNFAPDKQVLIEIFLRIGSKGNAWYIASCIHKLKLNKKCPQERKVLIQLAKLVIEKKLPLGKHIHNFGFDCKIPEDRQDLIEIAKLGIQSRNPQIVKFIKNFGFDPTVLQDKQILRELFILALRYNPAAIIYIEDFALDSSLPNDKQLLIKIAEYVSKEEPGALVTKIEYFGFDSSLPHDKLLLMKLAKLTAKKDPRVFCYHLDKFGFDQQNPEEKALLIDYAKSTIIVDDHLAVQFLKNFGFDINSPQDKKILIDIAKFLAQNNGKIAAVYINEFGFDCTHPEDKKTLFEIAILALHQNPRGLLQYIKKFGFDNKWSEDKIILNHLIKIALKLDPLSVCAFIENFNLDFNNAADEKILFKIAKTAAKQNSRGFYHCIHKFNFNPSFLSHQKFLFEIAKLSAQHVNTNFGCYLRAYGLNQEALIEVTTIHALLIISQMNVVGMEETENIFNHFRHSLKENHFPINHLTSIKLFFKNLHSHTNFDSFSSFFERCKKIYVFDNQLFSLLEKTYQDTKVSYDQTRFFEWVVSLAMIASTHFEKRDFRSYFQLIEAISSKSPALRSALTTEFVIDLFNSASYLDKLRSANVPDKKSKGLPIKHTELPCLVLAGFQQKHKEINLKPIYINFLKKIKSCNYRDFRYATHQNLLIQSLLMIKTCNLSANKKAILMTRLSQLDFKTLLNALKIVKDLIALDGTTYLADLPQENLIDLLKQKLQCLFQEKFHLTVENFEEKYQNSFQQWRQKEAIITYAGKIESLDEPDRTQAREFYSEFITSVLNNQFDARRYTTTNNPHLLHIATNYPEVFQSWQQPISLDEATIQALSTDQMEKPLFVRIHEQLKLGLQNQHLDRAQQQILYPHLSAFIEKMQDPQLVLKQINEDLYSLKQHHSNQELHYRLNIEKKIITIFLSEDKKVLQTILQELEKLLPTRNVFNDSDIKACLNFFKKTFFSNNYTVTDDATANDFFLMGTEVHGSCQNIEGLPHLNVALLAYFLDGKHRNLLVKNEGGKIVARCVLRLLVDDKGQPVLFQERMYVADDNPNYSVYLRQLALAKAKELNIPLVIKEKDHSNSSDFLQPFEPSVNADKKPVPFEYVDAHGCIKKSAYTIKYVMQVVV